MIDDPILLNDWHVVAKACDLGDAPKGVRLLGRQIVLWRNSDGVHAWRDLCLHRGAQLSLGRTTNNCLACPYHGWEYNGSGQCVRIPAHPDQPPPAKAQTTVYAVQEKYGLIWVCLGTPPQSIPGFAEGDDPSFRKVIAGPYLFRAHGTRVVENGLDVAHFPFVHAGYLGDPSRTEIGDYEVEVSAEGLLVKDIPAWQPDPDGTGCPATVHYTFRVPRPLILSFRKLHEGKCFSIFAAVTPVADLESVSWLIIALNYATETSDEELVRFQDAVSHQDIPVVESQRPEQLPLDLQAELHLRSDRAAIAYRQWLKTLGLRHGTA